MFTKKQQQLLLDVFYDTLKECKTPEERGVLCKLNSNFVKAYSQGKIKSDELDFITSCFDREKKE